MSVITKLFRPQSVAIVGASGDPSKTAGRPIAYLLKHGYRGDIYPVNPKLSHIGELACFADIASIPLAPDVAIVLLGADRAHLAVRELATRGAAAAIVLASGYGETGVQGARKEAQLREAAGSMRILGPNTIGLVNLTDSIVLSASGALEMDQFIAGKIGVVSQSGGILGSLLSRAAARGIGLSKLISTSNELDLDLADFIEALVDDAATHVIALYIEAVRHPQKFRQAALRAASVGKPIVAFKIGRSEAGARAAVSHTGAMAGSDQMYDAFFRQLGIVRAQTFGDLLDVSAALATGRTLRGKRVAILTSTGGAGTLVSDSLGVSGFSTPAPDSVTASALRELQTGDHAALDRNPIDVTLAGLQPDLLRSAIKTLLASPSYDALAVVMGSSSIAMPELMTNAIQACLHGSDKPVIAYVSPHAPRVTELLNQQGVPAFAAAESCTAALTAMWQMAMWQMAMARKAQLERQLAHQKQPQDNEQQEVRQTPLESVLQPGSLNTPLVEQKGNSPSPNVLNSSRALDGLPIGPLNEVQAKQLFGKFGIRGTRETIVETPDQAEKAARAFEGRVVLKLLSNQITHKSDIGGVAIGLNTDNIAERMRRMAVEVEAKSGIKAETFLVQEMISGGTEMILGLRQDALGIAVLLGMGGVSAELFNDTSIRMLAPGEGLNPSQALAMAQELKTWPLLDGFRGRPKCDVAALVDAIVNFSWMAIQLQDSLIEAEINPLFVLGEGQGALAADGVVVVTNA